MTSGSTAAIVVEGLVKRFGATTALDGVSLTVAAVGDDWFEVSLIPTTLGLTTLGAKGVGDPVNLEVDVMAKHIEKLLQHRLKDLT